MLCICPYSNLTCPNKLNLGCDCELGTCKLFHTKKFKTQKDPDFIKTWFSARVII